MSEKVELSIESMSKVKQAAEEFKNTLVKYFKENIVEVKDWKFGIESAEDSHIIDATVKIKITPKKISKKKTSKKKTSTKKISKTSE